VRSQQLPEYADGVVTKSAIFMRRGMSPLDELFCIAHEDCHINFHSDAIAYQDLDLFQIAKDEAQANGYAMLVLFPDLKTFETEEHFLETSPMPEAMNQLRLAIKRKLNI
jgi:Zn-dependent peptidase ImmA (M78 family)